MLSRQLKKFNAAFVARAGKNFFKKISPTPCEGFFFTQKIFHAAEFF